MRHVRHLLQLCCRRWCLLRSLRLCGWRAANKRVQQGPARAVNCTRVHVPRELQRALKCAFVGQMRFCVKSSGEKKICKEDMLSTGSLQCCIVWCQQASPCCGMQSLRHAHLCMCDRARSSLGHSAHSHAAGACIYACSSRWASTRAVCPGAVRAVAELCSSNSSPPLHPSPCCQPRCPAMTLAAQS